MLQAVINAVVPIFGLIFLGWLVARQGLLKPAATEALNQFVIYLALPALLFLAMARSSLEAMSEFGFVASFVIGTTATSLLYIWLSRREKLSNLPRTINSMSASYPNTGFMGIPLVLILFGDRALAPIVIACVLTVGVQFAVTIVAIEVQRARAGSLLPALKRVSISLFKNPILVAPLLGLGMASANLSPPQPLVGLLDLLAAAATPCALLAIGLFLAQSPMKSKSPAVMQIVILKLFVHPFIVGVLALGVFDLDPIWAWTVVLSTALPVGTGPFMLATLYREDASVSARAILLSTLGSALTLSLLIGWINSQGII
jgi:malonate transporter and related proteins